MSLETDVGESSSQANRVVLVTIGTVLLAGVLSAGATLLHLRSVADSYDKAVMIELREKALAYGDTARAFLDAAGPEGFSAIQDIVSNSGEDDEEGSVGEGSADSIDNSFSNQFQGLEVWNAGESPAGGYQPLFREELVPSASPADQQLVSKILAEAMATGRAAADVDAAAELIVVAVPFELDEETSVLAVATLSAEEEFAFFAAQRGETIRNGIVLSAAIVAIVSIVGGGLSLLVSRQLSRSHEQLQAKSRLLEAALGAEKERARRDPLTGTLNHAAIIDEARTLLGDERGPASHALAMVDVDGLKAVNDTFGHQIGDDVLTAAATALAQDGAIVGRYGGDEFIAILPGADRTKAERYRAAVLDDLEGTDLRDPATDASVPVRCSVGIAVYPADAGSLSDLIRRSDEAMYAQRRQQAGTAASLGVKHPLTGDRAAEMVGELVPFLTSAGNLDEKLRLVGRQLSVGAGYDAVNFILLAPVRGSTLTRSTFGKGPDHLITAWDREGPSPDDGPHPLRLLLEGTKRPLILEDPQNDSRLTQPQRDVLKAARLESALVVPMLWKERLIGAVSVASARKRAFGARDAQFLTAVATQVTAIVRMEALVNELQSSSTRLSKAQEETVTLLAASAEAHDSTTGLHLQGVRALTESLALELGYGAEDARELGLAAVLHDIGKLRVHDSVLSSSGALTDEDWEVMKEHTMWGANFLTGIDGLELAATIARSHHERWNGTGYPGGLAGEDIPEAATIVSVADSFDAMTSDRPYRAGRSIEEAVQELQSCSGTQFSPRVIEALRSLHSRRALAKLLREDETPKAA